MNDSTSPTPEDIIDLVERMRHMQKQYFRTHTRDVLEASKLLERQVDQAIAQYRQPQVI